MFTNTTKTLAAAAMAGAVGLAATPAATAAEFTPTSENAQVLAQDDDFDDDWDDQDDWDDDDQDDWDDDDWDDDDRGMAAQTAEDDWDDADDDDDRDDDDRGMAAQTGSNSGQIVGGGLLLAALVGLAGVFGRRFATN